MAEIHAAIVAIWIAIDEQIDSLEIHTDSMYLIDGAIEIWENDNWMTPSGEPIENTDKWLELDEAIDRYRGHGGVGDLSFYHVPGHNGNFGIMQADRMAKDATISDNNNEA